MRNIVLFIMCFILVPLLGFAQTCNQPVITESSGAGTYCLGEDVTLEIKGDLGDAEQWQWYTGSCGGDIIEGADGLSINVKVEKTTSYFVRGIGTSENNCVGLTAKCTEVKVVLDDIGPDISGCPKDIEVINDEGSCGAKVEYKEPTGIDNCDGEINWELIEGLGSGAIFPVGTTTEKYLFTDSQGNRSTCIFSITVIDFEAPVITLSKDKTSKWPPNHKPFKIDIGDYIESITDNCEVSMDDLVINKVSSDEEQNGSGDGNTENDIVIADDCRTVHLLAERKGSGNGRVYTINLAAADIHDNIAYASIKAIIRHDNGKNSTVVDDGPVYVVNGCDLEEDDAEIQPIEETTNAKSAAVEIETYPNPANKSLKVKLISEFDDQISIDLYNLSGKKIRHLFNGALKQGHGYSWDFDIEYINDRIFLLVVEGQKIHRLRKIVKGE